MKKSDYHRLITGKGGKFSTRKTVAQLREQLDAMRDKIGFEIVRAEARPSKWDTANDWLPIIEVDQKLRYAVVTVHDTAGHQKNASISTENVRISRSDDGTQLLLTGTIECKNWNDWRNSKTQNFCYAIFIGDSGHVYIHRAPATKGWLSADPGTIRKRLRKLGIGAESVLQQGDFLLKPANGNAYDDAEFAHERMGSGHHNFELPQLYHRGQFWVKSPALLIHTAVDGIQHPDVVVPAGKYIVGTTANSLRHSNKRD